MVTKVAGSVTGLVTRGRKSAPDWLMIRVAYEVGDIAVRALARDHGISHVAVMKRAKAEKWHRAPRPDRVYSGSHARVRPMAKDVVADMDASDLEVASEPPAALPELTVPPSLASSLMTDPKILIDQGRDLTHRLLAELSFASAHEAELIEAIDAYTADDKDGRRRYAMTKAVELPSRAIVLKNLAIAARTLADAAPGKKEEAQDAAAKAGKVGRFATPATPPQLVVNNAR